MSTVADIRVAIESLWPHAGAESWDAPGLVCGNPRASVSRVMFMVDATESSVRDALEWGADLIVTHHPLLMRGVTTVAEDLYKGSLLTQLIRANCALIAVHTNGDSVSTGTSVVLARTIGVEPRATITQNALGGGMGIIGDTAPVSLGDFARRIASALPNTAGGVRVSGEFSRTISSVSLCAGAGDSLLSDPAVAQTDVYVTSDLRHHPASEFREQAAHGRDTALIDISHWAAEWLWLDTAARELGSILPSLEISVSEIRTDPWDFAVIN